MNLDYISGHFLVFYREPQKVQATRATVRPSATSKGVSWLLTLDLWVETQGKFSEAGGNKIWPQVTLLEGGEEVLRDLSCCLRLETIKTNCWAPVTSSGHMASKVLLFPRDVNVGQCLAQPCQSGDKERQREMNPQGPLHSLSPCVLVCWGLQESERAWNGDCMVREIRTLSVF